MFLTLFRTGVTIQQRIFRNSDRSHSNSSSKIDKARLFEPNSSHAPSTTLHFYYHRSPTSFSNPLHLTSPLPATRFLLFLQTPFPKPLILVSIITYITPHLIPSNQDPKYINQQARRDETDSKSMPQHFLKPACAAEKKTHQVHATVECVAENSQISLFLGKMGIDWRISHVEARRVIEGMRGEERFVSRLNGGFVMERSEMGGKMRLVLKRLMGFYLLYSKPKLRDGFGDMCF